MLRTVLATTALGTVLALSAHGRAVATDFDEFFVFGDSLSDTGSLFALTGGRIDPFAPTVAPSSAIFNTAFPASLLDPTLGTPTGQFSNGISHIDVLTGGDLTEVVGPFDPIDGVSAPVAPGLPLVAPVTFDEVQTFDPAFAGPDGFNFAHGGATTGLSTAGGTNIGFLSQVGAFLTLQGGGALTVDEDDAVSVFIGGNDFFDPLAVGAAPDTDTVASALTNVGIGLSTLDAAGVDNFIVFNLPNLGGVPLAVESSAALAAMAGAIPDPDLQSEAIAEAEFLPDLFTMLSGTFNASLETEVLQPLKDAGNTVFLVDVETLFDAVQADPEAFGFTNATTACFSLVTLSPTGACTTAEEVETTVFIDSLHLTETANQLLGEFALGSIENQSTAAPFFLTLDQLSLLGTESQFEAVNTRLNAARAGLGRISLLGDLSAFQGREVATNTAEGTPVQVAEAGSGVGDQGPLGVFLYGSYRSGDRTEPGSTTANFDFDRATVVAGVDYAVDEHVLVGIAGGYGRTTSEVDGNVGETDVDSFNFSAYASLAFDSFYGDLTGGFSFDQFETDRTSSGPLGNATGDFNGSSFGVAVNAGYNIVDTESLAIGPTAGFRYIDLRIESFTEEGAGPLNLEVDELELISTIFSVGLQASGRLEFAGGAITPHARAAFEAETDDQDRIATVTQAGGQVITAEDGILVDQAFVVGGGLAMEFQNGFAAVVDGQTRLIEDGTDFTVAGRLAYRF